MDANGQIWLATTQGVKRLDDKGQIQADWAIESVLSIAVDQRQSVWLGTTDGLVMLDSDTGEVLHYGLEQGVRLAAFVEGAALALPDSQMMLAGPRGLILFNPQTVAASRHAIKASHNILLTDFQLFNQSVPTRAQAPDSPLLQAINETDALTLDHQSNWFSVHFAAADLAVAGQQRFQYRMVGLSQQWITTGSENASASFTSVAPGSYRFEVKAVAADGSNESVVRALDITITPPWYDTNLAKVLYVVAFFAVIWLIYTLRTRQLRLRSAALEQGIAERTEQLRQRADTIAALLSEKEQLLEDKDRLIANISHEFRTPLTLILGPLESALADGPAKSGQQLLQLAKANGGRLLAMVDQLLDIARLKDNREERLEVKDVVTTCRFLLASFKTMAEQRNIALGMSSCPEQPVHVRMQPDALEKILSNLLTNAFKYSPDHQSITMEVGVIDESQVAVRVMDTGPGISEADQQRIFERFARLKAENGYVPGAGIGLALVKETDRPA